MKIFLGFAFRDQDKDLVNHVDRLLASQGIQPLTGEALGGGETAKPGPKIFISSSSADAASARGLREALAAKGVIVQSGNDPAPGLPWEKAVDKSIAEADAAVFVISDQPNLVLQREVDVALARRIPVVPVVIGNKVQLPRGLEGKVSDRIAWSKDIAAVSEQIRGRIRTWNK